MLRRIIVLNEGEALIDQMINNTCSERIPNDSRPIGQFSNLVQLIGLNGQKPDLSSLFLKTIRKKTSDLVEKQVISYVLAKTGWNKSKASKILGISYKALYDKIKELELKPTIQFEIDMRSSLPLQTN